MKQVVTILFALLILCSCYEGDSYHKTRAAVTRLKSILASCEIYTMSDSSAEECIADYASKQSIPKSSIPSITHDYYGSAYIFSISPYCLGKSPKIPYSKGRNKVDDCGEGDDITPP